MAKLRTDQTVRPYYGQTPPSGAYQNPWNILNAGTGTPVSGTAYYNQLVVGPQPLTIQSLAANQVAVQSGGTGAVTLALYPDDGSGGQPLLSGSIASGATSDATTAAGFKPFATSQVLQPGLYWTAFLLVTSGTVSTASTWFCPTNALTLWSNSPALNTRGLAIAGQASLPTTGTLVPVTTGVNPIVSLRRA